MTAAFGPFSFERVVRAAEKVQWRLRRATSALEAGGIAYAVGGDVAVAVWAASVDDAAVRNAVSVEFLIRRDNLAAVTVALEGVGFIYRHVRGEDMFLDGPVASGRGAVHVIFAGERVRAQELLPNPDVLDSEMADGFRVLDLQSLVQIKLTAFRDKDRTHLRDLIDLELIDAGWVERFPAELGERLQLLIDTPEG